jgi:predicted Rdx family selenoprotein|tara:strand:+ start:2448 stop:2609 length:162 start_codon:yes stop_codon:yes gene_type:complete
LADELDENFSVKAELFEEGKGIFDVIRDGELVYSKYDTGRFPESGEVSKLLGA